MRARAVIVLAMTCWAAATACAEVNLGAGAAWETASTPLFPVVPMVFIESIYRVAPWASFGVDLFVAGTPFQDPSFANGLPAGPELYFGADASYRFPRVGPVEPAVLVGGWGFQDYENRVTGVAAQTGLEATVHVGGLFFQARGLYRFYSSTGYNLTPSPLGTLSIALLGGWSFF